MSNNNNLNQNNPTQPVQQQVTTKIVKTPTGIKKVRVIKKVVANPSNTVVQLDPVAPVQQVTQPTNTAPVQQQTTTKIIKSPTGVKKVKVIKKVVKNPSTTIIQPTVVESTQQVAQPTNTAPVQQQAPTQSVKSPTTTKKIVKKTIKKTNSNIVHPKKVVTPKTNATIPSQVAQNVVQPQQFTQQQAIQPSPIVQPVQQSIQPQQPIIQQTIQPIQPIQQSIPGVQLVQQTVPIVQPVQQQTTPVVQSTEQPVQSEQVTQQQLSTQSNTEVDKEVKVDEVKNKTSEQQEKPKKSHKKAKILCAVLIPLAVVGAAAYPVYMLIDKKINNYSVSGVTAGCESYIENLSSSFSKTDGITINFDTKLELSSNDGLHALTGFHFIASDNKSKTFENAEYTVNKGHIQIKISKTDLDTLSSKQFKIGFTKTSIVPDSSIVKGTSITREWSDDNKKLILKFELDSTVSINDVKLYNSHTQEISSEEVYCDKELSSGILQIEIPYACVVALDATETLTFNKKINNE